MVECIICDDFLENLKYLGKFGGIMLIRFIYMWKFIIVSGIYYYIMFEILLNFVKGVMLILFNYVFIYVLMVFEFYYIVL